MYSTHAKQILAYAFGARKDQTLRLLMRRIRHFNIRIFHTDDWGAYQRHLPQNKHLISKRYTQGIERVNLTLRTRIKRLTRRTICFSKSLEMHDKVIGEFINRHYFQTI